ncbi:unnamed protein product [Cylicostephanus goldi]|uniref:Uncharacterized protein n=1 Tax=Cylicostephanus goldi TaxID=71465 RepID=A0A3P6UNK2_CYLGO|nr:unnamed protein product [Cylicostephanus goldi]
MLIFFMVPILDYSECIKYHNDLTDEEKALCMLSVRLPTLAEMALDKMLGIIESLAVAAPKDSASVIGNFKVGKKFFSKRQRIFDYKEI